MISELSVLEKIRYNCFRCELAYFLQFGKCHLRPLTEAVAVTAESYLGDAVFAEGAPSWESVLPSAADTTTEAPSRRASASEDLDATDRGGVFDQVFRERKKNPKYHGRREPWNRKSKEKMAEYVLGKRPRRKEL